MKPSKRARELFLSYNLPQWPGWESSVKVVEAAITAAEREAFEAGVQMTRHRRLGQDTPSYDDWRKSRD